MPRIPLDFKVGNLSSPRGQYFRDADQDHPHVSTHAANAASAPTPQLPHRVRPRPRHVKTASAPRQNRVRAPSKPRPRHRHVHRVHVAQIVYQIKSNLVSISQKEILLNLTIGLLSRNWIVRRNRIVIIYLGSQFSRKCLTSFTLDCHQ